MTDQKVAAPQKANAKTSPKASPKPRYTKRTVSAHPLGKLNVRSEPKANAPILRLLDDGEVIGVIKESDMWLGVEGGGYVMAKYIV